MSKEWKEGGQPNPAPCASDCKAVPFGQPCPECGWGVANHANHDPKVLAKKAAEFAKP